MNKVKIFTIAIGFMGANVLADAVCTKKSGETICQKGVVEKVNTSGILNMQSTEVEKKLLVKGQASIKQSKIGEMKVYGEITLTDSTINGSSEIFGMLNTQGSIFLKEIYIYANYMSASDSKMMDIIIDSKEKEAEVSLRGKTIVGGNIVFKGKPGVVSTSSAVKILGKIINGKRV